MSALKTQLDHILQYWDILESESEITHNDHKSKHTINDLSSPISVAESFTEERENALQHSSEAESNGENQLTYRCSGANSSDVSVNKTKNSNSRSGKEKVWLKQSLHRLELARAALSVYTSNTSSELRPTLQTLFKFIFDLTDTLLTDKMSNIVHVQNNSRSNNRASNNEEEEHKDTHSFLTECEMSTSHVNAVAVAYAKVRATEVQMNDLVEASSAQRDKFAAQLELSEMKQHELTELLMHQIELTDGLLRNGSVIIGNVCNSELGGGSSTTTTNVNRINNFNIDVKHNNTVVPLSINEAGVIRDESYVNRLITRARREKEFESMECKVIALTEENKNLQNKVSELLRLNGRYARQSIELSARISLIHQHNIQLATDAQLHQKNLLIAEQRVAQLQSQILKLRHLLLMWMATASVPVIDYGTSMDDKNGNSGTNVTMTLESVHKQLRNVLAINNNSSSCDSHAKKDGKTIKYNNVCDDKPEEEYSTWRKEDVVYLLSKKLFEEDEECQKSILEKNINVIADNNNDNNGVVKKMKSSNMFHILPHGYSYVVPYSLNKHTPLHLRTNQSMVHLLTSFHPLLAEAIVQELLRQRSEFNTYYEREVILHDAIDCFVPYDKVHARAINMNVAKLKMEEEENATNSMATHNDKNNTSTGNEEVESEAAIPFDAFVALFINVMWLNRRKNSVTIFASDKPTENKENGDNEVTTTATNDNTENKMEEHNNTSFTTENTKPDGNNEKHVNMLSCELTDQEQELRNEMILIHTSNSNTNGGANALSWKSKIINDQLLELPPAGQRLAYSLDTLSRNPRCGFLTYAFGYVSRREVSELIFDVLREERRVMLQCCQLIEQNWNATLMQLANDNIQVKRIDNCISNNNKDESKEKSETENINPLIEEDETDESIEEETANENTDSTINGYIPSVQFAKLLAAMYPCYSVEMLTDLMYAAMLQTNAFASSTSKTHNNINTDINSVENRYNNSNVPQENKKLNNSYGNAKAVKAKHKTELMVYYSILLPERLLCDRENVHELYSCDNTNTTSSVERKNRVREDYSAQAAIAHAEWASPNAFSTLFYKFIIDDALHGIQRVKECVEKYEQEQRERQQEQHQQQDEPQKNNNEEQENVNSSVNEVNQFTQESNEKNKIDYGVMQVTNHKARANMSIDEINRFIFSHLSVQEQDYWNMSLHAALKRYAKAVLSKDDYHVNNYMQVINIVPVVGAHMIIRIAPNRDFHSVYGFSSANKEITWTAEQLRFINMFDNHWYDVVQNINKLCENKKNICVAVTANKENNDASNVVSDNEKLFDTIYTSCKEFEIMLHQVDPHRLKLWGTSLVAKGNHLLRATNSSTLSIASPKIATKTAQEKEKVAALSSKPALTRESAHISHDRTEKKKRSTHNKHKRKNDANLITTVNSDSTNNNNNDGTFKKKQ